MSINQKTSVLKNNSILKSSAAKSSKLTSSGQHDQPSQPNTQKEPEPFQCVMCSQEFSKHNELITHFRLHGSQIDIQGRPILESTLLKYPQTKNTNSTTKIDLIECEWCSESFHIISKAIEHKHRKHRYEMNYFCKTCGKLFPLKVCLHQHERIEHSKIDDFVEIPSPNSSIEKFIVSQVKTEPSIVCRYCSASFENLQALKFHEKSIHRIEMQLLAPTVCPPPSKKIKMNNANEVTSVYYCHLCGTEYIIKYNLRKHLEDYHTTEERNTIPEDGIIICKACEAIFYSKKAYDIHNINHRPDDLYVTCEEQRQKVVARVDQDFDICRVPKSIDKFIPRKMPVKIKKYSRNVPATTTKPKLFKSCEVPSTSKSVSNTLKSEDQESLSPVSVMVESSSSSDDDNQIIKCVQ